MRTLVLLAVAAACNRDHSVAIFFGATEDRASTGLVCPSESDSLLGQGQSPGQLQFGLVIDVVDFKGAFPTCFPDDLIATCSGSGTCQRRNRTCIDANVTYAGSANPVLAAQHELASLPPIDFGATDTPVLVRLTAFVPAAGRSMTPCEDFGLGDPTVSLVGNAAIKLVGCAYSCPVFLDDVNTLATGLATSTQLTTQAACQTAIAQCAGFPENVESN
ncbi:MAG TPA: hypothetical protein VMJ10_37875 [Kofleriaceae bacterium]|nr:hypothetical protein [Kofleriaceae bacterium]